MPNAQLKGHGVFKALSMTEPGRGAKGNIQYSFIYKVTKQYSN